jgi:hypothetical protein
VTDDWCPADWPNRLMIVGRMCSASSMASLGTVDDGPAPSFSPNDKGQLSVPGKGPALAVDS